MGHSCWQPLLRLCLDLQNESRLRTILASLLTSPDPCSFRRLTWLRKLLVANVCMMSQGSILCPSLTAVQVMSHLSLSVSLSLACYMYIYIYIGLYRIILYRYYLYNYLCVYIYIHISLSLSLHAYISLMCESEISATVHKKSDGQPPGGSVKHTVVSGIFGFITAVIAVLTVDCLRQRVLDFKHPVALSAWKAETSSA